MKKCAIFQKYIYYWEEWHFYIFINIFTGWLNWLYLHISFPFNLFWNHRQCSLWKTTANQWENESKVVKNQPASAEDIRDMSSIIGSGRYLGERKWKHTPVFLLGDSYGQRSQAGYIVHRVAKSRTWLSDFPHSTQMWHYRSQPRSAGPLFTLGEQLRKTAPNWDIVDLFLFLVMSLARLFTLSWILICKMKVLDKIIYKVISMFPLSSKTVLIIMWIHIHNMFIYDLIIEIKV